MIRLQVASDERWGSSESGRFPRSRSKQGQKTTAFNSLLRSGPTYSAWQAQHCQRPVQLPIFSRCRPIQERLGSQQARPARQNRW